LKEWHDSLLQGCGRSAHRSRLGTQADVLS
jgi:hypothetical protein